MQKLPDCPVETTLGLISNRWKVLIIRDLLEGKKAFRRIETIDWECLAESTDIELERYGEGRTAHQDCLPGGAAQSRI